MNKEKISDELLDNLDNESIRKLYFSWLEGIIVLGHIVLIGVALQSVYDTRISLANLFEELIITFFASLSIFYVYQCRQSTMKQKIIPKTWMLKALRIGSFLGVLFLFLISIAAMSSFDLQKEVFASKDWFNLFLSFVFLTSGIIQFYYTITIRRYFLS